ncbi:MULTISPECIES: RHS repeat-associated core domain-containing protein [unclassified Microbacterium]|uniref:RHS repeat-associated core domain-containing protein n=1 Tax=unclassified Microbacterium TaxID=2609290 RepID=UPI0034672C08
MNKPVTASTGLTTVGARTYDPVLGKFLSVDPVIDTNLPQQNTGYTYSGNNPTTYMDPTGLRLDQGCGWGVNCSKRPVSSPPPSYFVNVVVQTLSDGTPIYQRRPNPDYKPRLVTNSTWGPAPLKPNFNYTSLSDFARAAAVPTPTTSNKKPPRPEWGPLIEWKPENKGTVDFGASICAGVCLNASLGHDGSGRIGIGFGLEAGVSFTAGVSSESPGGLYLGGSCAASAGPAGIYVSGGIQQNGPLTYGGGGFFAGAGLGCSADAGFGS